MYFEKLLDFLYPTFEKEDDKKFAFYMTLMLQGGMHYELSEATKAEGGLTLQSLREALSARQPISERKGWSTMSAVFYGFKHLEPIYLVLDLRYKDTAIWSEILHDIDPEHFN